MKIFKTLILLATSLIISGNILAQDYAMTSPIGYGASATGGTGGTVVTVSTVDDLETYCNKSGKYIILVSGTLTFDSHLSLDISDKTIIGLPGSKLYNPDTIQANSGILYIKGSSNNLILRNLTFVGPCAYDTDGWDNLCIDGGTNIWVDHCDFQDGVDGNFDNKGDADNITITWCRFRYLNDPDLTGPGDSSTGDHRFSNLLGSSSTDAPSDGTFSFTWAYCWWDEGCVQRMVRARNAELHFLNCYWNSSDADYYIGPQNVSAYVEGCYFEGLDADHIFYENYGGTNYCKFVSSYGSVDGVPSNSGTVSAPSYSYTALSYTEAKNAVSNTSCGAGATLLVDTSTGDVSSSCSATNTLDTPTSITANASTTSIELNWGEVENATSYTVNFCSSTGGSSSQDYNFNSETAASYITTTSLTNGLSIVSSGKAVTIKSSSGTYGGVDITQCASFAGGGSTSDCALSITTDGAGTLTLYSNAGTKGRYLVVNDGTDELVSGGTSSDEFDIDIPSAGTYYIYSAGSGIDVYLLSLSGSTSCTETTVTTTSYTVTGLTAGTTYTYQVKANADDYSSSGYSTATSVTTPTSSNPVDGTYSLTSGSTSQTVDEGDAITSIVYSYSGTFSGITWTGTTSGSTAPSGISVSNTTSTITISGSPAAGTYGYSFYIAGSSGGSNSSTESGSIVSNSTSTACTSTKTDIDLTITNNFISVNNIEVEEIALYTITGNKVESVKGSSLNISSLYAGVYIVVIKTTDGKIVSKKIIKK